MPGTPPCMTPHIGKSRKQPADDPLIRCRSLSRPTRPPLYYARLDVSLEETTICIVDDTGAIVRELRALSDPESLICAFDAVGLPMARIGLEACSQSAWLHQGLTRAGLPALCIETPQAKAAMGAMPNKTDRNDARGLAQIIRTGWYRQVHIKSVPSRMARSLLVAPDGALQAAGHGECRAGGFTGKRAQKSL